MSQLALDMRVRTTAYEALSEWKGGSVYFLSPEDRSVVKIGYSSSNYPLARLRSIQTGCPYRLEMVAWMPGTRDDERRLHNMLAPFRMSGEWFQMTSEVRVAMWEAMNAIPGDLFFAHHWGLIR